MVIKLASTVETLISKDTIFISDAKTSEEVFAEIADKLVGRGLVKPEFLKNIIEREENYPTGMDLTPVDATLPNIAIPHTEVEFVNTRKIVPIKLNNEVEFKNMINPEESLKVKFLFMILNNDPDAQANILSEIMGFVATTDVKDLQTMFNATSTDVIFEKLENKFE